MWLDQETRRERYARLLVAKMCELQRRPTNDEVKQDPSMPQPNDYAFYWGSFEQAVNDLWSKVRLHVIGEGGVNMAKQKPKAWLHTPDELLELAVQKCIEAGKVPNRCSWTHDSFLKFEEIVAVLGKGDWNRALMKITLAYNQRSGAGVNQEVVAMAESVKEEKLQNEPVTLPQMATKAVSNRGKRYTLEELKLSMAQIQELFGISGVPTQMQINEAAHKIATPCYATFLRVFGPKRGWGAVLGLETTKQE